MTAQQILHADVLDILFEKRNKAYGAYFLRKRYPARLLKATGITGLLVLGLLFFATPSQKKIAVHKPMGVVSIIELVQPKKTPEPPKQKQQPQPPAAPQQVKQSLFIDKIKVMETPTKAIATQDELTRSAIGNTAVAGSPFTGVQPPQPPASGIAGSGEGKEVEKADPPLPSRQPQFPGGAEAWQKFLSRHLTPPADLEAGEKRTVLIRFAVDEEGTIANFQVVQSGGTDFDNEVIRVLKKMPRWLPAIQNGRPVAVSFTQPVTFQSQD